MSFSKRTALALLPQLSLAIAVLPRDTVSCSFSTAASSGDTCQSFSDEWGITVAQFESYNPGVQCPNLVAGQSYCVVGTVTSGGPTTSSAPLTTLATTTRTTAKTTSTTSTTSTTIASNQPQQTGIPSNCNHYYKVESGDSCQVIEGKFGISNAEFDKWNPSLNSDCTNLLAGYYYCVSVPGATTTTAAPTTPTTTHPNNGITTPTPTQAGMVDNCNKFDLVKSGDTCDSIASGAGISTADLYKWNPAVGTDCHALWVGYNVCVGIVGSTPSKTQPGNGVATPSPIEPGMVGNCNKFYYVKSGDSCYSIGQSQNVAVSDIEKWNPKVGSDCSDLFADDYICVGVQ